MAEASLNRTVMRTFKFRLNPTAEQDERMRSWCGAVRAIYNAALQQRQWYGRPAGTDWHRRDCRFNANRQGLELKHARAEFGWLADCPADILMAALRDLDKAFQNFFEGRARYPSQRRKHQNESFQFRVFQHRKSETHPFYMLVVFGRDSVILPKIGRIDWVKHTHIRGEAKMAIVVREGDRWFICVASEIVLTPRPVPGGAVGIDVGVAVPLMTSEGEALPYDRTPLHLEKRRRRLQQELSRCRRGSRRRTKRRKKLAAIARRIAARRKAQLHQVTTDLAGRYGLVAIEDLRVQNMTASAAGTVEEPGRNVKAKAGLNRSLLDVSPGLFRLLVTYKVTARGGMVVAVDPRDTSRTCPACGHVDAESRRSQAEFRCIRCGHEDNADVNAARNILRRALASLSSATVSGRRKAPSEPRRRSAAPKPSVSPSWAGQPSESQVRPKGMIVPDRILIPGLGADTVSSLGDRNDMSI